MTAGACFLGRPRQSGVILILVAGICAMLLSISAAMAIRARGLDAQARTLQSNAQARMCLTAAMAYLVDHFNTTGHVHAAELFKDFNPAVRIPLVNDRADSWRSGWFRIYLKASSIDLVPSLDGWSSNPALTTTMRVPLWHDFIISVGGGPSRGLKLGESDGEVGSLSTISSSDLAIARKDEVRYWFQVRMMPPLWYQGEPFQDTNANGKWDSGEPFWEMGAPPNSTYQLGEPYSDLNSNRTWDTGEPFYVDDGIGSHDDASEVWIDSNGDGLVNPGEWTERSDNEPYADNGRHDGGVYFLYDTRESWTDLDNNGLYDAGEPFVDTNANGVWDKDLPPFRGWGPARIIPLTPLSDADAW